jgi:hypothetical protein
MSTERWPRIRIHEEEGALVLREGLILCFVMNRSHREVGAAALRALEVYRRAIHPQDLDFGPSDYDWRPLDEAEWLRIRQKMLNDSKHSVYYTELVQSAKTAGAYYFRYQGLDLERPASDRGRNDATSVLFHLPTEYLEEHGPGQVRALALEMAAELPFNFGYVSLAFLNPESYWYIEYDRAREFCFRYPGLDLYHPDEFSGDLGTRARGAYWLTFLGQPLLNDLGGEEALRRRLPSPDISFQPLPGERLLLTLGEWPEAGDTQIGYVPPLYRELARVLKTWLYLDVPVPWGGFSRGELRRWLRRYLR